MATSSATGVLGAAALNMSLEEVIAMKAAQQEEEKKKAAEKAAEEQEREEEGLAALTAANQGPKEKEKSGLWK